MSQTWKWEPQRHECAVIFGGDAIAVYEGGETKIGALQDAGGVVKFYDFPSVEELNAFLRGIEEAQCGMEGLAVDDLTK